MASSNKLRRVFRFSIRSLLILCAIVAIPTGLVGRAAKDHFNEQRVVKSLEEAGVELTLTEVLPKGFAEETLHLLGFESMFKRLAAVHFPNRSKLSDELASQLSQLAHLTDLSFDGVSISDRQLMLIGRSKSLIDLRIHAFRESASVSKIRTIGRQGLGSAYEQWFRATSRHSRASGAMRAVIQRMQSLAQFGGFNTSYPEACEVVPSDEGVLSLTNHPTLKSLSLLGCNVSDQALRRVLSSIKVTNTDQRIYARRYVEMLVAGVYAYPYSSDQIADDRSELMDIYVWPRAGLVDFTRLKFVLPENARWELQFLGDEPQAGEEQFANFLQQLKSYQSRVSGISTRDIAPEIWDLASACQNMRSLRVRFGANDLRSLAELPQLEKLVLDRAHVSDDDIQHIAKLRNLKHLSIPRATITSVGLKRLMESGLQLDELVLPASFSNLTEQILSSGLCKKVTANGEALYTLSGFGESEDSHLRVPDLLLARIEAFERALKHAKFPAPPDAPGRPEDELLFHQRESILALSNNAAGGPHERTVDLLERTIARSFESSIPTRDLLQVAVPTVADRSPKQTTVDTKDRDQLARLFLALSGKYAPEKALETRVRQFALQPPTRTQLQTEYKLPKGLCQLPMESELAKQMQNFFYLLVDESDTKLERPSQPMFQHPQGVPILAPWGKQLASITSTLSSSWSVVTEDSKLDGATERIELPIGTDVCYVDERFFPVTVELEDLYSPPPLKTQDLANQSNAIEFDIPVTKTVEPIRSGFPPGLARLGSLKTNTLKEVVSQLAIGLDSDVDSIPSTGAMSKDLIEINLFNYPFDPSRQRPLVDISVLDAEREKALDSSNPAPGVGIMLPSER